MFVAILGNEQFIEPGSSGGPVEGISANHNLIIITHRLGRPELSHWYNIQTSLVTPKILVVNLGNEKYIN